MKRYWEQSVQELESEYGVTQDGLTAERVEEIRRECGENVLEEGKRKAFFRFFWDSLQIYL